MLTNSMDNILPEKTEKLFKNEKESCWYFFQHLRKIFTWAVIEKIPDVWNFQKLYDWRMFRSFKYFAFECKHIKKSLTNKTDPFKLLEPHQAINLLKVLKNGWQSYIVVYSEPDKDFYLYEFYDKYWWK